MPAGSEALLVADINLNILDLAAVAFTVEDDDNTRDVAEARCANRRCLLSGTSCAAAASHAAYRSMVAAMSMACRDRVASVIAELLKGESPAR